MITNKSIFFIKYLKNQFLFIYISTTGGGQFFMLPYINQKEVYKTKIFRIVLSFSFLKIAELKCDPELKFDP